MKGLQQEIKDKYDELGYSQGWRFLNCPEKNLVSNNGIIIITLNPGVGNGIDYKMHSEFSSEAGCSFYYEDWQSPVQDQFKKFLKLLFLEIQPNICYRSFINSVLIGYFIPFRSRKFKDLSPNKKKSIDFGIKIWRKIIEANKDSVRLVVCIDNTTLRALKEIFSELNIKEEKEIDPLSTGWGKYQANIFHYSYGNKNITLLKLPHLSRFRIFGREIAKNKIDTIMKAATHDMKDQ